MQLEYMIIFAVLTQVCLCDIPAKEDEALRRVFEFLKRKYSGETTDQPPQDVHDALPIPTQEPPTDEETVEQKQISLPGMVEVQDDATPVKNDFHKMHSLPGCDFLLNFLHDAPSLPIKNDVIDFFDQSSDEYGEGLVTDLRPVLEYSGDYDAVALLATRKVTRLIFIERLRCPATKFDMFTVKQMLQELTKLIEDEDDSMYDFLATMIYDLPDISYRGYDPNYLAHEMTRHIHAQLFNDTIDYLLGTSLLDVEGFARYFYETLHHQLPKLAILPDVIMRSNLKKLVQESIVYANVHCPTAVDVTRRHLDAVWDMTNGLKEIETYQLCMQVRDYLGKFVTLPAHVTAGQVKDYNSVMKNICGAVGEYVETIIEQEQKYQKIVATRDPLGLQEFFQHYLTEDELTVLAEVLSRLHWTPLYPVTDKPYTPENTSGEFLPKTHVITNELQDIDFWTSYLETLTQDTFEQMDLLDFKESIRRWLKEKQSRLDIYYNMRSAGEGDKDSSAKNENDSESVGSEGKDNPLMNITD